MGSAQEQRAAPVPIFDQLILLALLKSLPLSVCRTVEHSPVPAVPHSCVKLFVFEIVDHERKLIRHWFCSVFIDHRCTSIFIEINLFRQ